MPERDLMGDLVDSLREGEARRVAGLRAAADPDCPLCRGGGQTRGYITPGKYAAYDCHCTKREPAPAPVTEGDEQMPKRTITRGDYYALHGLLALANEHNRALTTIKDAATKLTGDEDDGLTGDAIWSGDPADADDLLAKLGITVEDEI